MVVKNGTRSTAAQDSVGICNRTGTEQADCTVQAGSTTLEQDEQNAMIECSEHRTNRSRENPFSALYSIAQQSSIVDLWKCKWLHMCVHRNTIVVLILDMIHYQLMKSAHL